VKLPSPVTGTCFGCSIKYGILINIEESVESLILFYDTSKTYKKNKGFG
jgi:hypothetical protein